MKGLRGLWGRMIPLVAFLVLFVGVVSAHAWNINGTISNTSGRTGRVYLYLQQQYGGDTGLGLCIGSSAPTWPNFTIRGVSDGTYILKAFVDGSGTGKVHPNDPTWTSSGTITISGGDHTVDGNTTVSFTSHPNVAPVAPSGAMILPGDNGAFVGWDEPKDSSGNKIADSYKVYWSTTSTTPKTANPLQFISVPGGESAFALFNVSNGTPLYVQVASLVGTTESSVSPVASATINPPGGGVTVSGTINLSGISAPTGNLYVALLDTTSQNGGPVAVAWVANPPQLSNTFTLYGVPNGTYTLYALNDVNGDGRMGTGDFMTPDQQAPMITVAGAAVSGQTVTLNSSKSSPFINTSHYQDSNTPPNDGYNVVIGARSMAEVLTNITVNSGPANGLSYPMDLGMSSWGGFQSWLNVNNNRPQPTDAYNVTVKYAGITTGDTLNLYPTVVLDSFATPTAPVGNLPYSAVTDPTLFSWTAPSNPPAYYTYSMWASIPGFNGDAYSQMPSGTLSQSVSGLTFSDGAWADWTITVSDAAGNQAQKSAWVTYTSSPAITSFSPTTVLSGDTLTITGINFNATAANNSVSFGCGAQVTATTATATQLTVVVPSNACQGSLQVTDTSIGKSSNYTSAQLNVLQTLQVNGQVTDATTSNGIDGATVAASFTVNGTPHTVNTTTTFGNYNLTGVPQNTDFTLGFSAAGYAPSYTGTINTNQFNLNLNMALFPSASFTAWNGGDATTGVIRGYVQDTTTMSGVAGVAVSSTAGTVKYDDGAGNISSTATSTGSNGVFYVIHVPDNASATITASKTGYQFSSVTATGHAGAITSVYLPAAPSISVSGTITNLGNTALVGATVSQTGTSNTATSTTGGAFTINDIPGGTNFELMMSQTNYLPSYTGPLNFGSSVTLPSPVVLFTSAELASFGINLPTKGAIIGRVINSQNPSATISGVQVTASPMGSPNYTVLYYDQSLNAGAGGFSFTATATDASGMFLVMNVDEGVSVNINAVNSPQNNIYGGTSLTTHANAVSEIAVPCNVPPPQWGNLQWPTATTVTTNLATENIYGHVYLPGVTDAAPGPVSALVAELGYGPVGTDPTNSASGWTWKAATYNTTVPPVMTQSGNSYEYATTLTVPTAGSYDYVYRYSYFGGAYLYGDLNGVVYGGIPSSPGKLTVNLLAATTTTLLSDLNPSTFGQGVTFTANVSPSAATGTVQLYVDGNLTASSNVVGGSASFGPITDLTVGAHSITATYSGDSVYGTSTTASPLSQTVTGSLDHFLIAMASPQTAGVAASITVTAKDAGNNTITGYSGTVHFTSTDSQAVLPADYVFTSSNNGTHTFTNGIVLNTTGSQTVTATDTVTSSITGTTGPITVNSAGGITAAKIGAFIDGQWYLDANGNGSWESGVDTHNIFGYTGVKPVAGDWNGSGTTKIGVYDPATFAWYLDYNGNGTWDGAATDKAFYFGITGAVPVTGDWNGSGTTKIGIYDPATFTWYLDYNGNGTWDGADTSIYFGIPGAIPVTGDWNGSGTTKIGVYDPATFTWYLDYNGNGTWDGTVTDKAFYFGIPGATPVAGDWSGSGTTKVGIYDPTTFTWYLDYNGSGTWDGVPTDTTAYFGLAGATPVTGKW